MTQRGLQTLADVDLIAAEDTRHSKRLLQHHNIQTPCISLHEHNEAQRVEQLLNRMQAGQCIALISDAGTPLISDPGYRLVTEVRDAGFDVVPVPGPCALIAALSASGQPTDRFCFEGFIPAKGAKRRQHLQALANEPRTLIFYESRHRIVDFLELVCGILGADRSVTIARELTKTFETIRQAPAAQLLDWLLADQNQQKGEFVVVVHGAPRVTETTEHALGIDHILTTLLKTLPLKEAVTLTVELTGSKRNAVYQRALILAKT